ncbi:hypothetical protein [Roseomonas sp. 18066]|uniref:hypothetical protein n=1 Tax=Roseomonas sp. 18066 TaxID=2681412 RepID=UPI00135A8DAD|nr:hypothetical protein [Roseomonas sp. 18066]
MPNFDQMRRLALARHLFESGVVQSRGPTPAAGLAILAFHDSVEFFLQVVSEKHSFGKERMDFMEYWKYSSDSGVDLAQKESMRRLNAARRGLKHQGVLPAAEEIEGFRASTRNFFVENSTIDFSLEFSSISMKFLINNLEARKLIENSEGKIFNGGFVDSIELSATAFAVMIDNFIYSRKNGYSIKEDRMLGINLPPQARNVVGSRQGDQVIGQVANELIDKIDKVSGKLSEAIIVIGQGIDFNSYIEFKSITPSVRKYADGHRDVYWGSRYPVEPTGDELRRVAERCIDFVVDAGIRLESSRRIFT